jgi:amino acid adenylation domain-containing protein
MARKADYSVDPLLLPRQESAELRLRGSPPAVPLDEPQRRSERVRSACIHHLFEARVRETPDAVAIACRGEQLTYRELNRQANRLAHHLQTLAVGPEVRVGICAERSVGLVAGVFGILKAGGAYLPLDPAYPAERRAFMLADARAPVLLTQQRLLETLRGHDGAVLCLDEETEAVARCPNTNPASSVAPPNLAYVIYTSGSTGRPKGVLVSHQNLVHSTRARLRYYQEPITAFLMLSSVAFDSSVAGLFWTLCQGGALVLPEEGRQSDLSHLAGLIHSHHVSHLLCVPSLYALLLEHADPARLRSLRAAIVAGESCPAALVARHFQRLPRVRLFNEYGPTEGTVWSSVYDCSAHRGQPLVPIGAPIPGMEAHLLSPDGQPVPAGQVGELFIGGEGVTRGYLNRPELTAERFVPHPLSPAPGARLYRTGDLARALPDGSLEFHGRQDHQVKIRGYRIELEEIEAVLAQHPQLREAVVLARADDPHGREPGSGDLRLVAYVVPREPDCASFEPQAGYPPAASERVEQWQLLYEETYARPASADPTFNTVGWNSSYTGEPLPAEEMREWVDQTAARILALRPQRLLEIGCGTGLLLFRLAPHCAAYQGTDFAAAAVGYLRPLLEERQPALAHVSLRQCRADDFSEIAPGRFDTVVLNSVVQYFPSVAYLRQVLAAALAAVAPGGRIFLGDLRSFPLLRAFHASVALAQAPAELTREQFRQRVGQRVVQEEELTVDPAIFLALAAEFPAIGRVEVQLKRGQHENEMTCFRYDVVLHVGPEASAAAPTLQEEGAWEEWEPGQSSLETIAARLQAMPTWLGVRGVPNARLRWEAALLAWLDSDDGPETVGQWLDQGVAGSAPAVAPEALWELGAALGCEVEIRAGAAPGAMDVLFRRPGARWPVPGDGSNGAMDAGRPAAGGYANDPLSGKLARQLVPALREYLGERLPEPLVPSAFVLLARLPLTPNGKVDRGALPAPEPARPELGQALVPPRDPLETQLVTLWEEILGIHPIGIRDSFFDLGGHSLLAVHLFARIERVCGKSLSPATLIQAPTIERLAEALRTQRESEPWPCLVPIRPAGTKPPLFCTHGAGAGVMYLEILARHLPPDQPFYGIQSRGLDGIQEPHTRVEEMAAHYLEDIRKAQPRGPYYLAGYSSGGQVALEMAQQLHAQGEKVAFVGLLNTCYKNPRYISDIPPSRMKLFSRLVKTEEEIVRLRGVCQRHADHLKKHGALGYTWAETKVVMRLLLRLARRGAGKLYPPLLPAAVPEPEESGLPPGLIKVWHLNVRAADAYVPSVYPGRLTLFLACGVPVTWHYQWNPLGWNEYARDGLEVHVVPGNHTSFRDEPNVQVLAAKLATCLERAQRAAAEPPF